MNCGANPISCHQKYSLEFNFISGQLTGAAKLIYIIQIKWTWNHSPGLIRSCVIFLLPLIRSARHLDLLSSISPFAVRRASALVAAAIITGLEPRVIRDWHLAVAQKDHRTAFAAFLARAIDRHLTEVIRLTRVTWRDGRLTFEVIITFAIIIIRGTHLIKGINRINGMQRHVVVARIFNLLDTAMRPVLAGASGRATTVNIKKMNSVVSG